MLLGRFAKQRPQLWGRHAGSHRQIDGSQDRLRSIRWELGEIQGERPQNRRVGFQPQPLGKPDRLADPKLVHELPPGQLTYVGIGPELGQPQLSELGVGDHPPGALHCLTFCITGRRW
ncbi:hypothetical protein Psta_1151 [Pirellula staleyi DSM 6068]|uniref:Uncharacterized protein n=1 Tax=Pirellula staleyi (strain ATCC 27377 / DSM 6068 / ICPB 4128) TaxID=530564 RepID=D2R906_PIRSD|nr:hypothetical protein Psta_1151 [Pirellula staleyi DSM 6068]